MNFNEQLDSMWEKDSRIAQLESQLAESKKFEGVLIDLHSHIADDKYASMFQSLGQYRKTMIES